MKHRRMRLERKLAYTGLGFHGGLLFIDEPFGYAEAAFLNGEEECFAEEEPAQFGYDLPLQCMKERYTDSYQGNACVPPPVSTSGYAVDSSAGPSALLSSVGE